MDYEWNDGRMKDGPAGHGSRKDGWEMKVPADQDLGEMEGCKKGVVSSVSGKYRPTWMRLWKRGFEEGSIWSFRGLGNGG